VTLLEGPAYALGALTGIVTVPGLPPRVRSAALLTTTVTAVVGGYDDLRGAGGTKGFAGHLGALARGEVTSGVVKIVGVGAAGLGAGALVRRDPVDAVLAGGVIAGAANLVNLLDLRPGRAVKAGLAAGLPLVVAGGPAAPAVAAGLGAAAALLPTDLAERGMLGDAGANALGAILGLGMAATRSRRGLAATLGALVSLTAASEAVSFSRVIDAVGPLRWLDRLGRR
jgi:UDP-N-acetylmuramyl pentapeptide phosphotransferase/UDP-N-acetylglucosamine-1-phosphate transferase